MEDVPPAVAAPDTPRRRAAGLRRAAASAGLILAGTAAGLLLTEAAHRRILPEHSIESYSHHLWPNVALFRPSTYLPFELAPNQPGLSNSLGMRDKEYDVAKRPGVFRIVVLGDSIAMYSTFSELMEEELERRSPGRYEVWNCGIGGQALAEYALQMQHRVPAFRPDLVLLTFCLNDLQPTVVIYRDGEGRLRGYWPHPGIPTFLNFWLYEHSSVYRHLLTVYPGKPAPGIALPRDVQDRAMRLILKKAAATDARVVAAVFPWLKPTDQWQEHERAAFDDVMGLLRDHAVPALDLSEALPSADRERFRVSPEDVMHPNKEGDRLAADAILRYLSDGGYLGAEDR